MESFVVVNKNSMELQTDVLLHPGEVLSMEIKARGIKKSEFANALGINPGNLTELLKGKRHISAMVALKIEALLEIGASFWLRVQADYDLGVAKQVLSKSLYSKLKRRRFTFQKESTKKKVHS
ncbi:MAG: HigA family addiction module antitoxin [Bacteroidota bacterium]